jgi:predicted TPR repeat methyltransferase
LNQADVLPYLGDLEPLFAQVQRTLRPLGYWLFSIELSDDNDYCLQPSARFAHHPDYIAKLQHRHQWQLIHQDRVVARRQAEQEVQVMIYLMQAL